MATKYTVKAGDNLSKIAQQFGVRVSDISGYASGNANLIKPGEVLTIPTAPAVTPVIQNGAVDISQVQEVKPYEEPQNTGVTVVRTKDNPDGTTTNFLSNGSTDRGRYTRNPDGSLNFVAADDPNGKSFAEVSFDNLAPEDKLMSTAKGIQDEITAIETRMANRQADRADQLQDAGVFDDLKTLNTLKAELRRIEDRDIEIPIEARQKLRGNQATKTEFNQETRPELEKNLLSSLAASRNVSRLTDTINTNISVIDTKIEAETARDEFLYKQKKERLEKVESIYGNIITEKQKAALEEKKFQYDLILEGVKSENSLRADLIKDLAKRGVGGQSLQGVMDMSIDDLISYSGNIGSPSRWSEMTYEEAAMTLDKDSFAKFEAYKNWEKTVSDDEKAAVNQALAVGESAKSTVQLIEDMLNDKAGLKTSVGTGLGNRDFNIFGLGTESTAFRAKAKQLLSQATLDKLLELKSAGGTLGAISQSELDILSNAATALGAVYDDNGKATGRFNFKEEDFRTALETMRLASMKTYIASSIGKEAYARAGYQNADFDTINKRYQDLKANPASSAGNPNYYQQDFNGGGSGLEQTFNVIKENEGLRTEAYKDSAGVWTIGFGTTQINGRPVQPGDRLAPAQAEALMQQQIVKNYTTFADRIDTEMTPNQFAALTSFEYNLGSGVWDQPTGRQILSLVQMGRYDEAGKLMLQYNKARNPATGQLETVRGLALRRAREANLLLS